MKYQEYGIGSLSLDLRGYRECKHEWEFVEDTTNDWDQPIMVFRCVRCGVKREV